MRWTKQVLMRANALVRKSAFSNRTFIRLLFGVEPLASATVQSYCEWSTILQRFILGRHMPRGARVLDLGAGAHAMLAIHVKKRFPDAVVLATDIVPERIEYAMRTVDRNGADVRCLVADVFERVPGRFDLILFDPPAIPTEDLASLGFEPKACEGLGERRCWSGDGGDDGLNVIRHFLAGAGERLTDRGRAIMCVNPLHCGRERLSALCHGAGLEVCRVHSLPGIVNAYVLANASGRLRRRPWLARISHR